MHASPLPDDGRQMTDDVAVYCPLSSFLCLLASVFGPLSPSSNSCSTQVIVSFEPTSNIRGDDIKIARPVPSKLRPQRRCASGSDKKVPLGNFLIDARCRMDTVTSVSGSRMSRRHGLGSPSPLFRRWEPLPGSAPEVRVGPRTSPQRRCASGILPSVSQRREVPRSRSGGGPRLHASPASGEELSVRLSRSSRDGRLGPQTRYVAFGNPSEGVQTEKGPHRRYIAGGNPIREVQG